MKKLIILSLVILTSINQAFAVATTGSAKVRIFQALSIANNTDLQFGNITTTGAAGTIILSPAATPTVTPSATVTLVGTGRTAGQFTVSGETSTAYSISLPANISLTGPAGSTPMTVTSLTSSPTAGTGTGLLSSATTGTQTLFVGGTLNIGTSQAAGSYSGTYTVTVNY